VTFDEAADALCKLLPPGQDREFLRAFCWDLAQCERMPEPIQFAVFEIAARHDFEVARNCVHHAANDGITGPEPFDQYQLVALHMQHPGRLLVRLLGAWLLVLLAEFDPRFTRRREAKEIAMHMLSEDATWHLI
jgi:lysozyme family protein